MAIYLIRHPQTIRNVEDKLTGWEESGYSELGKVQFEKIVEHFLDNERVIYSSDLPRARMLAEGISNACNSELIVDVDLRELNFKETAPHDSHETPADLMNRIDNFIDGINSDALVVSHAGAVNAIVENLCGEDVLANMETYPRDVIFKIETVKNENKLSVIQT